MAEATEAAQLAEALIGRYALEAEMYHELLLVAREQGGLLRRDEDVGRYAALFPRKDELLRSIGLIERELEPFKLRWWAVDVGAESRARLDGLLDGILGAIDAIREQESLNEQCLLSRGAAARRGLRKAPVAAAVAPPPAPLLASLMASAV